jgi:hypothetical protein
MKCSFFDSMSHPNPNPTEDRCLRPFKDTSWIQGPNFEHISITSSANLSPTLNLRAPFITMLLNYAATCLTTLTCLRAYFYQDKV